MINFQKAKENAENAALFGLMEDYGQTPSKYVFFPKDKLGSVPPGGLAITVDKESGECKHEYLERDGDKPFSPFKDYQPLNFKEAPMIKT